MYPTKEWLESRKLLLSEMENTLLSEQVVIQTKVSDIQNEKIAIDILLNLRDKK